MYVYVLIPGSDDYMNEIRMAAIQLVDNVLEQSVLIINSQQHSSNTLHSESEHFAITCDVNGVDLIKSPTIESMSGKSFDDNFSVPDVDVDLSINVLNNRNSFSQLVHDHSNESVNLSDNLINPIEQTSNPNRSLPINQNQSNTKFERIERKFERLSSQLDIDQLTDDKQYQHDFDMAMSQINSDEVSNLQSDFSKISWDDSISATTADLGALTPDNDLQDLPKGDC